MHSHSFPAAAAPPRAGVSLTDSQYGNRILTRKSGASIIWGGRHGPRLLKVIPKIH